MESGASTSPHQCSTSCLSRSDDLPLSPAVAIGIHRLLLSCMAGATDDAIVTLVVDLEFHASSLDDLRGAAMELQLLAKHNLDNRLCIATTGALPPLIALLSHADPVLQEHGITTLLNLSLCEKNKATIVGVDVVGSLVCVLKSAVSPATWDNAVCALLRLA